MTSRDRRDHHDDGDGIPDRNAAGQRTRSDCRWAAARPNRPAVSDHPCPTGRRYRGGGAAGRTAERSRSARRPSRQPSRCGPGRAEEPPEPGPGACRRFSVWGCQRPDWRPDGPCRCRWRAAALPCSCCRPCVRSLLPRRAGCPSCGASRPQDGTAVAFRDAETSWMSDSATRWRGARVPDMTPSAYRSSLRLAGRVSGDDACTRSAPRRTSRSTRAGSSRRRR